MSETAEQVATVPVLLQGWFNDGNDPMEAEVRLPVVPRKGDKISLWTEPRFKGSGGEEHFIDVLEVILCAWAPERIVVLLSTEGYSLDELRRVFDAASRNEQP